jgi:hypothetical protein
MEPEGESLMGWGSGIVDGREVGYAIEAECDFDGCTTMIDRGLGWVCGTMHGSGNTEWGCANYYCSEHRPQHVHDCEGPFDGTQDHEFTPSEDDPAECGHVDHVIETEQWGLVDAICGYSEAQHRSVPTEEKPNDA